MWEKWESESFDLNTSIEDSNTLLSLATHAFLEQISNKYKINHFTPTYCDGSDSEDSEYGERVSSPALEISEKVFYWLAKNIKTITSNVHCIIIQALKGFKYDMDSFDEAVWTKERKCANHIPFTTSFTHIDSTRVLDKIIEVYSFIYEKIQADHKNRLDTLKETQALQEENQRLKLELRQATESNLVPHFEAASSSPSTIFFRSPSSQAKIEPFREVGAISRQMSFTLPSADVVD